VEDRTNSLTDFVKEKAEASDQKTAELGDLVKVTAEGSDKMITEVKVKSEEAQE